MSEHVRLGGSKAHRFLVCHASPKLEQEAGDKPAGPHAIEGTVAHHIGETALRTGGEHALDTFRGVTIQGVEVTDEMIEAVEVYVSWVRNIRETASDAKFYFELPVTLAALNPPEEMRGSADFVAVLPSLRKLIVGDYKHGRGYVVEVKGNKQTRYYALATLLTLPADVVKGIDSVQMTIIQPRAFHPDGPVRSETISTTELLDFAEDLLEAARAIQAPDAKAVPGDHCLFCNAAGTCRAKADGAVAIAQAEFQTLADDPRTMDADDVAAIVRDIEPKLEAVEAWLKAARAMLQEELQAGKDVPGFKLVAKRATRVWADPKKVIEWAVLERGLPEDEIHTIPELISPAQMEKLVGKKNLPAELTVSVSSGYTLASADSSKPAARISAAEEFSTVNP